MPSSQYLVRLMKVQNKDDRSVPLLETDCGRWVLGLDLEGLGLLNREEGKRRENVIRQGKKILLIPTQQLCTCNMCRSV